MRHAPRSLARVLRAPDVAAVLTEGAPTMRSGNMPASSADELLRYRDAWAHPAVRTAQGLPIELRTENFSAR